MALRFRPDRGPGSPSASCSTASPSVSQDGVRPLGAKSLPKMRLATSGTPSTWSRWRMWTYSWKTRLGDPVPVGVQLGELGRRRREEPDGVVGHRRGRAVGVVAVVGEDHLGAGPAARSPAPVTGPAWARSAAAATSSASALLALVEVDAEVGGLEGAPAVGGVVGLGRGRRRPAEQQGQRQRAARRRGQRSRESLARRAPGADARRRRGCGPAACPPGAGPIASLRQEAAHVARPPAQGTRAA